MISNVPKTEKESTIYHSKKCMKHIQFEFHKNLIDKFANTLKLCEGIYPYEYKGSWKKIHKIYLSDRKCFHSNLKIEQ